MKRPDDPMREIAALRERLSRLSEASLHITEDLDLDAVLARGPGRGALPDRRKDGRHHHPRRRRTAPGLHHLRPHGRRPPAIRQPAGGTGVLRLPEQPARTAAARRLFRPYNGVGPARDRPSPGAGGQLPGRAHPSPGRTRRQPLSIGQGGRRGVHPG